MKSELFIKESINFVSNQLQNSQQIANSFVILHDY